MAATAVGKKMSKTAQGPYMGFALQPVRLCYHLLTAPDGVLVGLEHLDDVSVHPTSGSVILEQSKNSIENKPIGNKSSDLWKTFANWGDICAANSLDPKHTRFVLYAASPGEIGNIVPQMHAAIDDVAASTALTAIKSIMATATLGKGFGLHLGQFLANGDEFCVATIRNFEFCSDADPVEPIRQTLRATISDSAIDDFSEAAIGFAKQMVESNMRNHQPSLVDTADFRRRFQAFVRRHNLAGLLTSTTGEPSELEIQETIDSIPMYVLQLNVIEMKREIIVGAVSACLRATADKIKWADEGTIVEDSLNEFDASLTRRFSLIRDEIEDTQSHLQSEMRGRNVYRRCAEVQLPLEGQPLPSHFVEGAYNILADGLNIGWHPSYLNLLQGG